MPRTFPHPRPAIDDVMLYRIAHNKALTTVESFDVAEALKPRLMRSFDAAMKRLGTDDADVIAALILYIEAL